MLASETAQRIAGTFIEDDKTERVALLQWIQAECRSGQFQQALLEAVSKEVEPLRVDLAVVEKVEPDKITVKIPCRVADHESTSTFQLDVLFEVNPLTLRVNRI